jgi:hypothetical protein
MVVKPQFAATGLLIRWPGTTQPLRSSPSVPGSSTPSAPAYGHGAWRRTRSHITISNVAQSPILLFRKSCEAHPLCCAVLWFADRRCFVAALRWSLSVSALGKSLHATMFRNDRESPWRVPLSFGMCCKDGTRHPRSVVPQTSETTCNTDWTMTSHRPYRAHFDLHEDFDSGWTWS